MSDREQDLLSRVFGLDAALKKSLEELSVLYGSEARTKLRAMRDDLIRKFKESGIPANRELDHVKIVRPTIEAIETAFEDFI
jgi:chemotaxis regulatin CheY-phosphate phosphatase CheZ